MLGALGLTSMRLAWVALRSIYLPYRSFKSLRTNLRRRKVSPGSFAEATYTNASTLLRGQPLRHGQEMGGFRLGSTIVLVFEAPPTFSFSVEVGQRVKVGEKLGELVI